MADKKLSINSKHLSGDILDVDRLVKLNDIKEVTNPVMFQRNNIPTSDGLLSNEIFGITVYERANTCAYIDLQDYFINPELYKVWSRLDKKIVECIYGTKRFRLNDKGELEEDENGKTGVKFLRSIFKDINIARTASARRDMNVDFIEACKKKPGAFINKMIVIPAYYRDVDTSKKGKVSIGEINELYRNLLISARALKETRDYGLDMSDATRGRVQGLLVQIFDWFGSGTTVGGVATNGNIPGKIGVMRMSVYSKTTDWADRLVLSAPELKYESVDDMYVDLDYTAVPLAAALSSFMPFVIFNLIKTFQLQFDGDNGVPKYDKDRKLIKYVYIKDWQTQLSEARIKKEIDRFIKGYSNRFIPVELETVDGEMVRLVFKGNDTTKEDYSKKYGLMSIVDRDLTWCDLFFQAAVAATEDKHIVTTRYPIDSIYNQFPTKIHINSTNETEPMVVNGKLYERYPKIRQSDIGSNTSNTFVDTLNLSNLYLAGLHGDYDGDTTTIKGVYSVEANEELEKVMNSNFNYIDVGGKGIRTAGNEAIQCMYNLTLVLPEDANKLGTPVF